MNVYTLPAGRQELSFSLFGLLSVVSRLRFVTTFVFILFFLFLLCHLPLCLQAQNKKKTRPEPSRKTDSLLNVLNTTPYDTTKVNTLSVLGYNVSFYDTVKAIQYAKQGIKLAREIRYKKGLAMCFSSMGVICKNMGKFDLSIEHHQQALYIYEELDDKKGSGKSYIHLGTAYSEQGNYPKALENYQKALAVYQQLKDKTGIAKCYNVIGMVFKDQGNYTKAIEYYMMALKIREETGDKKGVMSCYSNIGQIHNKQRNYIKAIEYFELSLKLAQELKDQKSAASCYNNLGNVYMKMEGEEIVKKDTVKAKQSQNKAIEYFNKAIDILEAAKDKKGIAICFNNIGSIYKDQRNYNKGLEYFLKALGKFEELAAKEEISVVCANIADLNNKMKKYNEGIKYGEKSLYIARETGSWENQRFAYEKLSDSYKGLENFKEAMKNYELCTKYNDSIFDKEKNKQYEEMESKYQNEKKKKEIELLNKNKALQQTEIKQQKTQKYAFIGGFLLMLVLAVVIFKSYRDKRKANILLAEQKKEIEEKNEELNQQNAEIAAQRDHIAQINEDITDSIHYAQKIQKAVLPSVETEEQLVAPHQIFILYKPKDIVSGDFYFITRRKHWLLIAVADCTGHGVPGAFMSMLGVSFLNEIVAREDIMTASHVLDVLRQNIIRSLQQKGVMGEQKDGMDIVFVALNTDTLEMQYAGANNPLYIVETGHVPSLQEIRPDKMPVGIFECMNDFTNQTLKLQKDDIIYLMSDGYQDQFGGPKFKKFMSKNLKQLLMDNYHKPLSEQKEILDKTIEHWKNGYDVIYKQTDDITILGIKIK
ncbi:MAG: tetratricopeptide repeat protein [Bacteroidia bacterium]|nr:tetratricopeptide repeat protein [Bacteroidia bacterium]